MSDTHVSRWGGFAPDLTMSKRIMVLSGPIIFAMLTQTFVNIMDTFFVGKLDPSISIPGQAALGYSLPLLWSVGGFLSAIGVGTQAITARRYGAGRFADAGSVMANSLLIAFTSGIVCSLLGALATPFAFSALTQDPMVRELGIPYTQIRLLGVLSMVATMSCKAFYDGIGKTHLHMVAAIVMNILNLVLNYCLIFGVWIFPRMEVEGAAWASLISTYVGLAVMMVWTFKPASLRKFKYYSLSQLDKHLSWEIIRLSVPSGIATVFVMSGFLIFLKIIGMLDQAAALATDGGLGTATTVGDPTRALTGERPAVYAAAAKVIIDVMSIVFISSLAYGTATATLVSQSLGEGRPDKAERYGWESAKLGFYVMSVVGLLIVIWPDHAMDLISDDPQVIEAGVGGMRLLGFIVPLITIAFVFTQGLFGAGNTKFVMVVEMLLHVLCLIPITYLLAITFDLGFIGPWWAAAIYIIALAVIMGWKFWEGKWKDIKV